MELEAHLRETTEAGPADFDLFFRVHFAGVAGAAALVARDIGTGQDAAQEAFARVYARWHDMTSEEHARNFAYRVAINFARSHVRKHMRVMTSGLRHTDPSVPDHAQAASDWVTVSEALGDLTPRQRASVVLVDYADMEAAQAARILGMATGTVRVHLMRGRRTLREQLGLGSKDPDDADPTSEIFVINADGTGLTQLTDSPGLDFLPVWSPDGRWIAFASVRGATDAQKQAIADGKGFGGISIWVMAADGSDPRMLVDGGQDVAAPASWAS